jgi:hypothetical protein
VSELIGIIAEKYDEGESDTKDNHITEGVKNTFQLTIGYMYQEY